MAEGRQSARQRRFGAEEGAAVALLLCVLLAALPSCALALLPTPAATCLFNAEAGDCSSSVLSSGPPYSGCARRNWRARLRCALPARLNWRS